MAFSISRISSLSPASAAPLRSSPRHSHAHALPNLLLPLPLPPPPPSRRHSRPRHRHGSFGPCASTPLSAAPLPSPESLDRRPGYAVIEEFYDGINRRDLDSVRDLIAEDCVYEDLVFPEPFVGRKAILEFFGKFTGAVGPDLQFKIDDISKADPLCIGVTWHLEWRGKPFPFSKGCSFYRLTTSDGKLQIIYGRDGVEPAIKPGYAALVAIEAVAAVLQRFPGLADRF